MVIKDKPLSSIKADIVHAFLSVSLPPVRGRTSHADPGEGGQLRSEQPLWLWELACPGRGQVCTSKRGWATGDGSTRDGDELGAWWGGR